MNRKELLEEQMIEYETLDEQIENDPHQKYLRFRERLKNKKFKNKNGKTPLDAAMDKIKPKVILRKRKP